MTEIVNETPMEIPKESSNASRIAKEDAIAILVNDYNTMLREIINISRESNYQISKTLMLMKSTEREDFKLSLLETTRGAFLDVTIKDGEFDLIENKRRIVNEKEVEKVDQIIVDNPLKLIKGGFHSLGIKESHLNYKKLTPKLIELINLRNKIYTLMNDESF